MATKATIYKALLNIANMDTNYYNEHNLNSFFVSPNTYPKRDVFMNGLFVEIIR